MRKFFCVPTAIALAIIFGILTLMTTAGVLYAISYAKNHLEICLLSALPILELFAMFGSLTLAARRVKIYPDVIICKGLFPWNTIRIEYAKCNVGLDFHLVRGEKMWWIYFCYGVPPKYSYNHNSINRINGEKFRDGFIKMQYEDKLYYALLEILPKKSREELIASRSCAGLSK